MGLSHSPNIITNGLVLTYDTANTHKSWKGEPATNIANDGSGDTDWDLIDLGDAVITRNTLVTNYRYEIVSTVGGGFRLRFNVSNLVNNETYNLSFRFKITAVVNLGSPVVPTFTMTDWCDTSITKTTTENPTYIFETAFGVRATYDSTFRFMDFTISDNTTVEVWDFQLEQRAYPTPYTGSTRSNTEAIVDMVGGNTLTASSLTYASDGTFSFGSPLSDYITIPSISTIKTIISWVNCDTVSGTNTIYGPDANGRDNWLAITSSKAQMLFTESADTNNTALNGNTTILDDRWYQIACTIDTNTAKIYLNGVEDGTTTVGFTIGTWGSTASVGRRGGLDQRYFSGDIEYVSVYDTILTPAEIAQNFNAIRGRFGI